MQVPGSGGPKGQDSSGPHTSRTSAASEADQLLFTCLFFLLSQIVALWSSRFKFSQEDSLLASICYSPLFRLSILHQPLISYWPVHGLVVLRSGLALRLVRHQSVTMLDLGG